MPYENHDPRPYYEDEDYVHIQANGYQTHLPNIRIRGISTNLENIHAVDRTDQGDWYKPITISIK